jgi:hypothetical protein
VWGIGSYIDFLTDGDAASEGHGTTHSLSLTEAEFEREVDVAARRLVSLGFGTDDLVLVIAGVAEAVQFAPFQRAARQLGGISCTAEPSPFDARRTASFLEQYELRSVIGLDAAVLTGLEDLAGTGDLGDPATVLGQCDHLVARADAVPRLRGLGLDPLTLHVLGPTLAVECPQRSGAHVGRDAWTVSGFRSQASPDELTIAAAPGRDLALGTILTGVRGTVIDEPCPCGSDDPRVVTGDVVVGDVVVGDVEAR